MCPMLGWFNDASRDSACDRARPSTDYWARVVKCQSDVLSPYPESDWADALGAPGGQVKSPMGWGGEFSKTAAFTLAATQPCDIPDAHLRSSPLTCWQVAAVA